MNLVLHYLFTKSAEFRLPRVYKSPGWFISEIWLMAFECYERFSLCSCINPVTKVESIGYGLVLCCDFRYCLIV